MELGILYKKGINERRLRYVLNFIGNHPLNTQGIKFILNETRASTIIYNDNSDGQEQVLRVTPQELFFTDQPAATLTLVANSYAHEEMELYSVETEKKKPSHFLSDGVFGFDIFETIFFHISRIEELDVDELYLNARGQLSEELFFLIRQGLEKIPVVDHLVFCFLESISPAIKTVPTKYHLSHDIDFIEKYKSPLSFLRIGTKAFLRTGFKTVLQQYVKVRKDQLKDPYNNFDFLLSKDDRLQKTIYFLVDGKHKFDNIYDLSHPIFKSAIKLARERGYKIGIHPSFLSWKSKEMIRQEKEKLEQAITEKITKSRQHYLHFHPIDTVKALLDAGITEDASIGYTNSIGFKCGTGHSYFLYDYKNEQQSLLKETPLVYMDSAAINESKRQELDLEDLTHSFLMSNMEYTAISFNFHNSRFDPANGNYEALIRSYASVQKIVNSID